jgi:biopolymer transport protein ExbD
MSGGHIKKKKSLEMPPISTASLPDIVFMLLFFFMVTTVMREVDLKVQIRKPKATEIQKLERKSLVTYVYVGKPIRKYADKFGKESRIQLNDAFASIDDVQPFVIQEREAKDEVERKLMTVSIKADRDTKMGLITDLKVQLRKAQALKINYSTIQASNVEDLYKPN